MSKTRKIDSLLPVLPHRNVPLVVVCKGFWLAHSGYRDKKGAWRWSATGKRITEPVIGWEYQDEKARGRFKGSKIKGFYVTLKPGTSRVEQNVVVK